MTDLKMLLMLFEHEAQFKKQDDKLMIEAKGFHVVWRSLGDNQLQKQVKLSLLALDLKIKSGDNDASPP